MTKTRRASGAVALAVVALLAQGCFRPMPLPPTAGYGARYQGTGQPIYVKDSRTDWEITEGGKRITSEQALEASGDQEYETRRQIMKEHNAVLRREALRNRRRGIMLIIGGVGMAVAGLIVGSFVAPNLTTTTITPPTMTEPEMRMTEPSGSAALVRLLGGLMMYGGAGVAAYGVWGGSRRPPYERWRTPEALNRPAYIRQQTEAYNEKLGAPGLAEQPGAVVDDSALAPGQRKAPPARPASAKLPGSTKPAGPVGARPAPTMSPARPSPRPTKPGPTRPGSTRPFGLGKKRGGR